MENTVSLATARDRGREIAKSSGCDAEDAVCLRAIPVDTILAAQARPSTVPIAGGEDLPEAPGVAIAAGRFHRVPIIFGWNRDETTWQTALTEIRRGTPIDEKDYREAIEAFGRRDPTHSASVIAEIAAAYPLLSAPAVGSVVSRIRTDAAFICPTLRMLRDLSRYVPAYGYKFAEPDVPMYNPPVSFPYGIAHTSELQFLFPGFHGASGTVWSLSALNNGSRDGCRNSGLISRRKAGRA